MPARSPRRSKEAADFIELCHHLGTSEAAIEAAEKLGYDTGIKVTHPADPTWELPLYIANFVLMDYGTGAIIGCPAHDQRDLDFARKYGLPVIDVFVPADTGKRVEDTAFVPPKSQKVRYVQWSGEPGVEITCQEAMDRTLALFEEKGWGRRRGPVPPARLGHLAPALLGLPDPDDPLPDLRRGAGAGARTCR